MRRIIYLGAKEIKADNVAQTGLTWSRGEVREVVDDKKAELLLKHPRVWADADKEYQLQPEITLAHESQPMVSIIPQDAGGLSPYWEPVILAVTAEIFTKMQNKEFIAVFMTPDDQDAYAAWKKLEADTAPKKTGPKSAKAA